VSAELIQLCDECGGSAFEIADLPADFIAVEFSST